MSALEAAQAIRDGRLTSEELVLACLERIRALEDRVQAWAFLDPDYALEQARLADELRREGKAVGRLHGVPVGVKDIIDTYDMPTENGTVLHAGRRPLRDATVVARLRSAGAVILGKTVTTELATYSPGKTRHPLDPNRSPGGSSSGSAAAVAAGMVPLALGTQTNGSVIRPAAYCGIYGFKPTHGLISRAGIMAQSRWLDHVGVMARNLDDLAIIAEEIIGYDEQDPDTRPTARLALLEVSHQPPPVTPRLAFVKTPAWTRASDELRKAFAELVEHLGTAVEEVTLPSLFDAAYDWHRLIMEADIARSFAREYEHGFEQLSTSLRGQIERGRQVTAVDYNDAVSRIPLLNKALAKLFDRYYAILTPATTGTAPLWEEGTGDPVFCTLWTLCGTPAVTLPLMQGEDGLPLGVQLVGPRGDDARLLRTARWLVSQVETLT
jgi:Asp-tRNA(Asn)/Glu-tRNA(Gln) amidotransferase A subunit family amidase